MKLKKIHIPSPNFGRIIKPKTSRFERLIRKYAIYSPDSRVIQIAPIRKIFERDELERISNGMQARVFKYKHGDWVIKEGRWDLDLDLFGSTKLPMPAALTEKILNIFSYTFLPTIKEVLRQYKLYLNFVQYFGFFNSPRQYYHPNLELIHNSQKNIRDSLLFYKPEIEAYYKMKLNPALDYILASDVRYHNFLPKEYLLIGPPVSPQNRDRTTFYIIQEFVKGTMLHDTPDEHMSKQVRHQLILMIYLILLMNLKVHLLPDTRPRYPILQAYNWLTKTDNVLVGHNDELKFIDTRWFWDTKANFIRRGLLIPTMIISLSKSYLNYLLEHD